MGSIKDFEALAMSGENISQEEAVYNLILVESGFHSWVSPVHVKTIIHAIFNGMTIHSVKSKYGGAGPWLIKWAVVQAKVTNELCDDELGSRAIELINAFFPDKRRVMTSESHEVDIAGPRTIVIKRDPRVTFRLQIQ